MSKPTIISVSTAKGGVGKTTTTVAAAEFLAAEGYHILVIDADYQANCSISLIGNEEWEKLNSSNKTIKALLEDAINEGKSGYTRQFDVKTHIYKGVSNLSGSVVGNRIDLLASTPDLNDTKRNLYQAGREARFGSVNRTNFIEWGLRDIFSSYDFVLIDTHPDIDDMLHAVFYVSDFLLMPAIPDAVSSYGIKTMNTHIKRFSRESRSSLQMLGVVISMERAINVHRTYREVITNLCKQEGIPLFKTAIPLAAKVTESMEFSMDVNTLKQKYGGVFDSYTSLVEEILEKIKQPTTESSEQAESKFD